MSSTTIWVIAVIFVVVGIVVFTVVVGMIVVGSVVVTGVVGMVVVIGRVRWWKHR